MHTNSITVKNHNVLAALAAGALSLVGAAAHAADYTSFVRAEATYTDTGYKMDFAPKGYQAGAGLTFGGLLNSEHEFSLSTGLTDWTSNHNHVAGSFDVYSKVEQVPVLLNYRFHYTLDQDARYSVFAGPTVGFIHEKFTETNTDLGLGFPASATGASSESKWEPAYGGTVGVSVKIGKGWDVSATAQFLRVESHTFRTHGGFDTTNFKDAVRPSFALNIGYGW